MNTNHELDELFNSLKEIRRAKGAKAASLEKVLQAGNRKSRKWPQWAAVGGASLLTAALAIVLVFSLLNGDQAEQVTAVFPDVEISEVGVAASKAEKGFAATYPLGTFIIEDAIFLGQAERFLEGLSVTDEPGAFTEPAYDLKLTQEAGGQLNLKIWKQGETIFVYDIVEQAYYTTDGRAGAELYDTIDRLPFQ